ncbi:MAG: peptidylprolyl isomerase [Bacteroidales bacterium]|nr:MAG: peptidylprolyl isomerase [Bacteroidales bacterium]
MRKPLFIISILLLAFSCSQDKNDYRLIKIQTDKGEIVIRLYNETPIHRDNIIKLAEEKYYDGQIFHRIINNFVVQGGDPTTKNAKPDSLYGNGGPNYLIEAEFNDTLIHKRGAVGMAREGDDVNPQKKSSGSQFYIVKGKLYTNQQLDDLEKKIESKNKSKLYKKIFDDKLAKQKDQLKIDTISLSLDVSVAIDSIWETIPKFKLSEKQRKAYTTIGGIPHLDGNYTVFGEVIQGMDIIDEFSSVNTDQNDRPIKDITFSISVLKK